MVMTATVGNGTVGLRERKKARTRDALRDASLQLFHRDGFEQTTIEDIADACEVSPRTFFRYFPTKEDVLFSDADERCGRLLTTIAAQPPDVGPLPALLAGALAVADDYGAERARLVLRKRVLTSSPQLRASSAERQRGWEDAAVQLLAERAAARGSTRHRSSCASSSRPGSRRCASRSTSGSTATTLATSRSSSRRRSAASATGSSSATRSSPSVRSSRTTPSRTCCRGRRRRWSGTRR